MHVCHFTFRYKYEPKSTLELYSLSGITQGILNMRMYFTRYQIFIMVRVKLYPIPLHDSKCYHTPYTETEKHPGVMHCLIVFLQLCLRNKEYIYHVSIRVCVCVCVRGFLTEKKNNLKLNAFRYLTVSNK